MENFTLQRDSTRAYCNVYDSNATRNDRIKKLYIISLVLYLFVLPLNGVSLGSFGSAIRLFAVLPIILPFFGIIKQKRYQSNILLQIGFVLFACFSWLWSVERSISFDRMKTYLLLMVFIFSGTFFDYTDADIKKIKNGLLWSSRTTAIVILAFSRFSYDRLILSGVITEDPNYLCCYLVFGIAITLQNFLDSKKKFVNFLEFAVYFSIVVATGSRGGLLAVISCILVILFSGTSYAGKQKIKLIAFLFIVAVAFIMIIDVLPVSLEQRFSLETIISSGGTGRLTIWQTSISLFKAYSFAQKLFGSGTGTITTYLNLQIYEGYVVKVAAHNIFIETLLELGIIGLLIYSSAIFSFTRKAMKFKDKFAFSIIVAMIVLSLTTSLHTFKPYFNIMLFIIICQYRIKNPVPNAFPNTGVQNENSFCVR